MQPYSCVRFQIPEDKLEVVSSICSFIIEKKKGSILTIKVENNDYKLLTTNGVGGIWLSSENTMTYQPIVMEPLRGERLNKGKTQIKFVPGC